MKMIDDLRENRKYRDLQTEAQDREVWSKSLESQIRKSV